MLKRTIDILLVSETKIDTSFPQSQFCIDGYSKPFRLDRNSHGRGIIIFIRDDIPCKRLYAPKMDIEAIFFEIKLKKNKWLCCGGYNNHNKNIARYLRSLEESLESFIKNYDNLLILGDLNAVSDDRDMKYLCEVFKLKHLVKIPTCFKKPINPRCIDILLTNRVHNFQNTITVETVLSDNHKLTVTV